MKKNIFSFTSAAVLLLAVGLAGCSREDANEENGTRTMLLKVQLAETRAPATPIADQTVATFSAPGYIFFVTSSGTITKKMEIGAQAYHATNFPDKVAMTDITGGALVAIQNVPSSSSSVYVVGTLSTTGLLSAVAVGQNISTVLAAAQVAVGDVDDATGAVANVPLLGSGVITYASTPNIYEANVTIAPVVGRVELAKISADDEEITSFTVDAIYVNQYYEQLSLAGVATSIVDNASSTSNYAQATATDKYYGKPEVFDAFATGTADSDGSVEVDFAGVMAYNLLPPGSTYFPHLVVRITKVVPKDASYTNDYGAGKVWYLTVKNVVAAGTSQTGPFLVFQAGKIYKIADLHFGLGDLSPVPEPGDKIVTVKVTVTKWEAVNVDPVLGS
ncbi:MAG: hypothetical protein LBK12_08395 [Odoribacteraceae bacterium]|jgi:hypothetical protein|nr:hypothetical protein [Odoribacteraceae bacterium]